MKNLLIAFSFLLAAGCSTMYDDGARSTMANAVPESDIAAIVAAANDGEVRQGQAASNRATSSEVRAFAQMMVTDHTAALNNGNQVFARNNITPSDNATSRALRSGTDQTIANLSTYSGTAFDRTYMQAQVDVHSWLLNTLDNALIPSARNAEVRTLLQTQRGSVAAHLERARTILGNLR